MKIDISVVITFYRDGKFLGEAIDSVLKQTIDNYEIVLVDNNADEETLVIAQTYRKKFPERIRLVSESVQGISSARNKGILQSSGKFIALMDGDDMMFPNRLEKQLEAALAHPDAPLISSSYETFVMENDEKVHFLKQKDIHLDWIEMIFRSQENPCFREFYVPLPSTLFFDRKKILESGGFDPFFNGRAGEEIDFALTNWKMGKFFHLDDSLVSYRAKSRNLKNVSTKSWLQRTERQDRLFRKLKDLSSNYPGFPLNDSLRRLMETWLRETALSYFSCLNGKEYGRKLLLRSLSVNPSSLETWKLVIKSFFPTKFYPTIFWFKEWGSLPTRVDHEFFVNNLFGN